MLTPYPFAEAKAPALSPQNIYGLQRFDHAFFIFRRRFGWVTIHGPMAASPSLAEIPPDQAGHLFSLLTDPDYRPVHNFAQFESWTPGVAEGELVGGCLSIITTSIGTPYEIKTDGKILFLEDLESHPTDSIACLRIFSWRASFNR